jgi:hypothetical protein
MPIYRLYLIENDWFLGRSTGSRRDRPPRHAPRSHHHFPENAETLGATDCLKGSILAFAMVHRQRGPCASQR